MHARQSYGGNFTILSIIKTILKWIIYYYTKIFQGQVGLLHMKHFQCLYSCRSIGQFVPIPAVPLLAGNFLLDAYMTQSAFFARCMHDTIGLCASGLFESTAGFKYRGHVGRTKFRERAKSRWQSHATGNWNPLDFKEYCQCDCYLARLSYGRFPWRGYRYDRACILHCTFVYKTLKPVTLKQL